MLISGRDGVSSKAPREPRPGQRHNPEPPISTDLQIKEDRPRIPRRDIRPGPCHKALRAPPRCLPKWPQKSQAAYTSRLRSPVGRLEAEPSTASAEAGDVRPGSNLGALKGLKTWDHNAKNYEGLHSAWRFRRHGKYLKLGLQAYLELE